MAMGLFYFWCTEDRGLGWSDHERHGVSWYTARYKRREFILRSLSERACGLVVRILPPGKEVLSSWVHPAAFPHSIPTLMLRWAIGFLVIALIAAVLGFGGIAGTATGIAKILFVVFLLLFVISLLFGRGSL